MTSRMFFGVAILFVTLPFQSEAQSLTDMAAL
jgi:hypothetical protein